MTGAVSAGDLGGPYRAGKDKKPSRGKRSSWQLILFGGGTFLLIIGFFALRSPSNQLSSAIVDESAASGKDRALESRHEGISRLSSLQGSAGDSGDLQGQDRAALNPDTGLHRGKSEILDDQSVKEEEGSNEKGRILREQEQVADGRVEEVVGEKDEGDENRCNAEEHSEGQGDVLLSGEENVKDTADACCAACKALTGCNVWVYCEAPEGCGPARGHGQCWLKKQNNLNILDPWAVRGPGVPWKSGTLYSPADYEKAKHAVDDKDDAEKQRLAALLARPSLPLVYLDIAIKGVPAGRITIVLFADKTPRSAENFRALCTGEKGTVPQGREGAGKPYHFKGNHFYRIVHSFVDQGGAGTDSIYGGTFDDEEGGTSLKFDRKGLLAWAKAGPSDNTSHFFITMCNVEYLNGMYTIFGEVVEGFDVVSKMNELANGKRDNTAGTEEDVKIVDSGELRRH